ncbi:MAG TPA: exosortase/archaeosortase family protein [Methylomirabilota bacterium]
MSGTTTHTQGMELAAGLGRPSRWLPWVAAAVAFVVLFRAPLANTVEVWWRDPDAGHGLLLAPLAGWLAWRRGRAPGAAPQPWLGLALIAAAVLLRYVGGLATELFTMRFAALAALVGLVVFVAGVRQVLHWWLPATLLLLSLPLPELVLSNLALPLQLRASEMGAALLEARHVPVRLAGNVIQLPGHTLFVTEACSGLRSLSALVALGVLGGGLWLDSPWLRALLVVLAVPVAMVLNGVRIFLTGFAVHYVDPALGEGLMHYTEGWVMFVAALAILGSIAALLSAAERVHRLRRSVA